jgi:hypothetical protein
MIPFFRDPRLSDEARNYILLVSQNFQPPKGLDLKAMRERSENINEKVNQKFIGTFQGTEEERQVKIDETTGIISISNQSILMKNSNI